MLMVSRNGRLFRPRLEVRSLWHEDQFVCLAFTLALDGFGWFGQINEEFALIGYPREMEPDRAMRSYFHALRNLGCIAISS